MQVYLCVTPRDARAAMKYHNRLAHVAYRIGEGSQLLRQNLLQLRGGILSLSDLNCPAITKPDALCREIRQECGLRGYVGVLADFEEGITPDRIAFLEKLSAILRQCKRRLFIPEAYATQVSGATAVICTAVSGGSFRQRLEESIRRFGQVALDVERLTMDFTLPAPSGTGVPMAPDDLTHLIEERDAATFYSRDLCARYFTCVQDGTTHFFLYDDGETIRQKIRTGNEMGCCAAFLMYPEVKDLLPTLFQPGKAL